MRSYLSLSSDSKSRVYSTYISENITIVRFLFYLLSAAILINMGLQRETGNLTPGLDLLQIVQYFFIGIVAATIANSTGAGGGIVFLPIFIGLGFTAAESLSTSIAIQCFGMSSGALTWIHYRKKEQYEYSEQWKLFYFVLPVSALSSCLGLLLTQNLMPLPPLDVELLFALFSLVIGTIILVRTLRIKTEFAGRSHSFSTLEISGLIALSLLGGMITSWLSIGIGEILLIYLILLRVRLNVAVASAVCVSACSVLVALPYHVASNSISHEVLNYAAIGALIGGVIARSLATYLGAHKLKIATSIWIILSAIPYLILSLV